MRCWGIGRLGLAMRRFRWVRNSTINTISRIVATSAMMRRIVCWCCDLRAGSCKRRRTARIGLLVPRREGRGPQRLRKSGRIRSSRQLSIAWRGGSRGIHMALMVMTGVSMIRTLPLRDCVCSGICGRIVRLRGVAGSGRRRRIVRTDARGREARGRMRVVGQRGRL